MYKFIEETLNNLHRLRGVKIIIEQTKVINPYIQNNLSGIKTHQDINESIIKQENN